MSISNSVRRTLAVAGALSLATLTLVACNPPSDKPTGPLPESQEELVEAAKDEGQVSLGAGGHTTAQAELLATEFEAEYGIPVEFVRENSGQIGQKVEAQRDAGNISFDVISLNDASTLQSWADEDVLLSAKVANADDVIETLQIDGDQFIPFTWAAAGFVYNEAKFDAASVPSTWAELAQFDGRKVIADPGSSGSALNFIAALAETDPDALPAIGAGDVLTSESALALGQMVATGEADFGLPGIEHEVGTARAAGEPLAMGYPEGKLAVLPSYIAALNDAAHPAAARLLVQFSMSEQFQQAQREIGSRSTLTSVSVPEGLDDLGEDRMLMLDQSVVSEHKDELIETFESAVR